MKRTLLLLLLAFVAFFIGVAVEVGWHHLFLEGRTFNSMATMELIIIAPILLFYGILGWLSTKLLDLSGNQAVLFSVLVLGVKLALSERTLYGDPALVHYVWLVADKVGPSVSVLLGYCVATANNAMESDA